MGVKRKFVLLSFDIVPFSLHHILKDETKERLIRKSLDKYLQALHIHRGEILSGIPLDENFLNDLKWS